MRNEPFFSILDDLDVRVEYTDLSHTDRDGEYIHAKRLIRIQEGMSPRLHLWTLAHETWHAISEDEPTMFAHFDEKQERRADEWAALQTVDLTEFRDAEIQFNGHAWTIATHLGVVEDTIEVLQRMLSRVGDDVYLRPRMGAGNWDARLEAVA